MIISIHDNVGSTIVDNDDNILVIDYGVPAEREPRSGKSPVKTRIKRTPLKVRSKKG